MGGVREEEGRRIEKKQYQQNQAIESSSWEGSDYFRTATIGGGGSEGWEGGARKEKRRPHPLPTLSSKLTMLSVLAKRLTVLSSPDKTDSGIVGGITVVVIALGRKATTEFRPRWAAATRRRKRAALMMTA